MKRQEKNEIMKYKIVNAALVSFGKGGYQNTSIRQISELAGISKGIMYHYFNDKDSLYLHCAKLCFNNMAIYIEENIKIYDSSQKSIEQFLQLRHKFISKYPDYRVIFYETLFGKPKHLRNDLSIIRSRLENINVDFCKKLISSKELRISEEKVTYYFKTLINAVWLMLEQEDISNIDDNIIEKEEKNVVELLDVFFRGI